MAFSRPTLAKLIARARSDIETRLPGADAQIRRTVESVLGRVVGGAAHGLHGHLVWLSRQLMPDTAIDEFKVRWADIWGIIRIAATKSTGTVSITGVNTSPCPVDTLWQTSDNVVYKQDAAATIAGGVATVSVTAEVAGADGNQVSGAVLSLVTPVTGIDTDGTVDSAGLVDGADQETLAALLVRLLARLQSPPKGGGPGDYVAWAKEVAGTTRAWQVPNVNGLGTVGVYFVQDNDTVDIVPSAGEIATSQTYIDSKAPVTADVAVYGPTEVALVLTISVTPNTTAVKDAVTAEIQDLILRVGDPSLATTLLLSQIDEACSIAAGETDHTITLVNGGAAADIVYTVGQLPKLTTPISWV